MGRPAIGADRLPESGPENDAHLQESAVADNQSLAHSAASIESHGSCRKAHIRRDHRLSRGCGHERLGTAFGIGPRRDEAKATSAAPR
jgi:hypothetical protein